MKKKTVSRYETIWALRENEIGRYDVDEKFEDYENDLTDWADKTNKELAAAVQEYLGIEVKVIT
jgi:hypothetical protein